MRRLLALPLFVLGLGACDGPRVLEEATADAPDGYSPWEVIRLDDAAGCRRVGSYLWVRAGGLTTFASACLVDENGEAVILGVELSDDPWTELGWRRCDLRAGEGDAILRAPDCR